MFITDAEENRPLYIIGVADETFRQRLILAGIDIGDPVWKKEKSHRRHSVWVKSNWGEFIVSAVMSTELLVQQGISNDGRVCSLNLVPLGTSCCIVAQLNEISRYRSFFEIFGAFIDSELTVIKHIPRIAFRLDIGKHMLDISDETAFNIWSKQNGRWFQLGSQVVGKEFRPDAFTGNFKEDTDLIAMVGSDGNVRVKNISIWDREGSGFIVESQSGHALNLTKAEASFVEVRLCDICWSCGLCKEHSKEI